jgi:drug/metabolite transporter (DMT)-like permease
MRYFIGILQVLGSGICFGFLGIFARFAYRHGFSVGDLLSYRFCIAAILLWLGVLVFNPPLVKLPWKQLLTSLLLGALGYALFSTFYFEAIKGVSVPLAAMLLFSFPLFVNLGAHFILKEKMSDGQVASLLIASLGLILLLWGDFSVEKISAVFFGLGAAVAYSIYVLVSGRLQQGVHALSSSLYIITAAAATLSLFHQPDFRHLFRLSSEDWLIIGGMATISTIAPLTLFLAGLQKMKSSKASILVMVEPVTAALAASLILHEAMTPLQLSGAGLVLVGMFIDARSK